jgi:hypothetical protein
VLLLLLMMLMLLLLLLLGLPLGLQTRRRFRWSAVSAPAVSRSFRARWSSSRFCKEDAPARKRNEAAPPSPPLSFRFCFCLVPSLSWQIAFK